MERSVHDSPFGDYTREFKAQYLQFLGLAGNRITRPLPDQESIGRVTVYHAPTTPSPIIITLWAGRLVGVPKAAMKRDSVTRPIAFA